MSKFASSLVWTRLIIYVIGTKSKYSGYNHLNVVNCSQTLEPLQVFVYPYRIRCITRRWVTISALKPFFFAKHVRNRKQTKIFKGKQYIPYKKPQRWKIGRIQTHK